MKTKTSLILAIAVVSAAASAQVGGVSGIRVKAGYGWSGNITDSGGARRKLQGPEVGVEIPVQRLPLVEFAIGVDVLLGGQLSRGSDLDGNVYRFLGIARAHIPGTNMSAWLGAGWATAQSRGGQFGAFNGAITQIGLAIPLGAIIPTMVPTLEVAATMGGKSGLNGVSVGLSFRF
jgi:hypothetical protein